MVDPEHNNNAYFLVDKIVNELVDVEGIGVPKEDMAMSVEIEVVNCEVKNIPVAQKTYGSVNSATEPYPAISFLCVEQPVGCISSSLINSVRCQGDAPAVDGVVRPSDCDGHAHVSY